MKQSFLLQMKGVDPNIAYEAIVIDENDPGKYGRIKARVKGLMDSITDEEIKWMRPRDWNHPFGLFGGATKGATAAFGGVPRRGAKVYVYFPNKNPYQAVWSTNMPIDKKTKGSAFDINYPNRCGYTLPNGKQMIVDTQTNELILIEPGDMHLVVFGDVNQTIVGNHQLTVTSKKSDIPSYILNDPHLTAKNLVSDPKSRVKFQGLLGATNGSSHTHVTGNMTCKVGGSRKDVIDGNYSIEVGKSLNLKAGAGIYANGQSINLN